MSKMKVKIKPKSLLRILAQRNMSQNSLGRGARLTSGHVSQLIDGKRYASPRTRERILNALEGVSFDEIFTVIFNKNR